MRNKLINLLSSERRCEVMARYIDKDLLLEDIEKSVVFTVRSGFVSPELKGANKVVDRIINAPTADVEEVKHGEWIRGGVWGDTGSVEYKCSVCRETTYDADLLPRCPQCGAKMDKENT